jgi:GTPase
MRKPIVALVGRPNVGKSTLFNRLIGERKAVISEIPGTTRDRIHGDVDWNGVEFTLIDTGGIEVYQPRGGRDTSVLAEGSRMFVEQIKTQALIAIETADVVVQVVDVQQGVTAADEDIANILRKANKPVLVAANKLDHMTQEDDVYEFYTLGLGEVIGLTAIHGKGSGDLLDRIVESFADAPTVDFDAEDDTLRIAIVGRPNVGKSSLLNKILGHERSIVSDEAGTTRDAIDTEMTWHGEPITLIDTAGIRRRGKIDPGIEKYSVLRALKAIERADVALLLIDADEGITAQDAHIAGMVIERFRSLIILVNKWDLIEKDNHTIYEYEKVIRQDLAFVPYAPMIFISALTGQRVHRVLETAMAVWEERFRRIPTSELNRVVRQAIAAHPPTGRDTRKLKIYYATQVRANPPTILFHVNDTRLVHFSYERYLENRLRETYPLSGTPLRFSFRKSAGKR